MPGRAMEAAMERRPVEIALLGPIEVRVAGRPVPLRGTALRLLVLLALRANAPVSLAAILDNLWDGEPPRTAAKVVQNAVSRLRKELGRETVLTRGDAYELRLDEDALDVSRFARLVTEARGVPAAEAAERLREALALWRGPT